MSIGVDGARGGWLVAVVSGRSVGWSLRASFADVLADANGATVAVDMPIGLVEHGHRPVDQAGRAWLRAHGGPPASIFLTPPRPVLRDWRDGLSYADALAAARSRGGPGFAKQAWYLLPRVADCEDAVLGGPGALVASVLEAHPECAFRRLGAVADPKRTPAGLTRRRELLARFVDLGGSEPPPGAAWDDVLDATVLALVARRAANGEDVLIADGGADALGLPMRIAA